jgi:hypothetical protein
MNQLPDITTFTREQLVELIGILHEDSKRLAARFDEAIALLRSVTRPTEERPRA